MSDRQKAIWTLMIASLEAYGVSSRHFDAGERKEGLRYSAKASGLFVEAHEMWEAAHADGEMPPPPSEAAN